MACKTQFHRTGLRDYTTRTTTHRDAAALTPQRMLQLSAGIQGRHVMTPREFYLAKRLSTSPWRQSTPDNPVGICGPIGPTEQLPLVARLVNDLDLNVKSAHFWGMDEWFLDGREVPPTHPLSFEKADRELCFNRIRRELRMPDANLHYPKATPPPTAKPVRSDSLRRHQEPGRREAMAFKDPPRRTGKSKNQPRPPRNTAGWQPPGGPTPLTLAKWGRRGVQLSLVPTQAISVGPVETWKAEKVSNLAAGTRQPVGQRLTCL
jgi:glucosamine-6-phosphate deaminase